MGLSFSNIQVHMESQLDETLAGRIAEILMRGTDAEPVADASEADVVVRVCAGKDSPWVTVLADSIDDDLEEQLLKTRALSEALKARALAIACFDSDYLCLNLVDAKTKTDVWAAHGKFPFGKAPRRSNPAAWKAYVKDAAHFAQTLREPSVFAEDALPDLAAELALPAEQAFYMEGEIPEDAQIFQFGYKLAEKTNGEPPRFQIRKAWDGMYFKNEQCVAFVNKGGASKGVIVMLTGACIQAHEVKVEKVEVEYHLKKGKCARVPVEVKERIADDGIRWLRGTCPELPIPPAVKDSLPWRKKHEMEGQRDITVRCTLAPAKELEQYGDFQITLVPKENIDGLSGCVLGYIKNFWSPFSDADKS